MKHFLLLSLLIATCRLFAQQPLNVLTFNIRYDTPRDSANAWPLRKDKAASQILFHDAHVVGVQEALHHQLLDLQSRLPGFGYTGIGREGGTKGEYSAIFYDSSRLIVLQSATFWLSPNPQDTGKKAWDANLPRIVTWAKFKDKKSRKQFFVFNTHFDHLGKVARANSAKLLLQKVNEIGGKLPCVITGDFNASPDDEPIRIILNPEDALRLTDAKSLSVQQHYGPSGTFNGFRSSETTDKPIDFIFIRNNVRVLRHATLSQTWMGRFSSDHFPVFASVVIQ